MHSDIQYGGLDSYYIQILAIHFHCMTASGPIQGQKIMKQGPFKCYKSVDEYVADKIYTDQKCFLLVNKIVCCITDL